jgi:hypothetical protein
MTRFSCNQPILLISLMLASIFCTSVRAEEQFSLFARKNLVAWCVVPFDAARRGPAARAEMLQRLGIKKLAYDWRQEHVPTFEEEILELKKRGIQYFAFWGAHEEAFTLFNKHKLRPQIWITMANPQDGSHEERVAAAAQALLPLVDRTQQMQCQLGLYNHGGWAGEPDNLVAVCRYLREHHKADHVGIVYNQHHGHGHIDDFQTALAAMKPYLLCLNLNGMNDNAQPKILPIGSGQHDARLLRIIKQSGYRGPIGILDHRPQVDAEKSLTENLAGLEKMVAELDEPPARGRRNR